MKQSILSGEFAAYGLTTTLLGMIALGTLAVRVHRMFRDPQPISVPIRVMR